MHDLRDRTKGSVRKILLTFDDGPDPSITPRVLDILASNDIKAVFCVVGNLLERPVGQRLVKRAVLEGHSVGNHTFSHANLNKLDRDKIIEEVQRTHKLICDCIGSCEIFRPPYGAISSAVDEIMLELGYKLLLWNVDSLDWKLKRKAAWVHHALEQINAREESIVLMHDIHVGTVENLPLLIGRVNGLPDTKFVSYL